MRKNKELNFRIALKQYRRNKRKYKKLLDKEGASLKKMEFLKKRILKLREFLRSLVQRAKLAGAMGALGLAFITSGAEAQNFIAPQVNPFGLANYVNRAAPAFADIDNDGDLDCFEGVVSGDILYFENIGTASAAVFGAAALNPFGLQNIYQNAFLSFGDIDNDGDLDIIAGEYGSNTMYYFENTGDAVNPVYAVPVNPAFGIADSYYDFAPVFVDLDGDLDLDIMAGEYYGNFLYYENLGSVSSPSFAPLAVNPFGLSSGYNNKPTFADLDNDGDLDMLSGNANGNYYYYENTGSVTSPVFATAVMNPFNINIPFSQSYSVPSFVDIDNDGDFDIISGNTDGDFVYFNNCAQAPNAINTTPEANLYICISGSTTINASGVGNISWYDAATGGNYLGGGVSYTTPVLSSTTTYWAQDSTVCGTALTPVVVTVSTLADPTITITQNPAALINVAQGGTASASSTYPSNDPADAFNGDSLNTGWGSDNLGMPQWLEYDFGAGNGKLIKEYALIASSFMVGGWASTGYSPTEWNFEGYNGSTWDVLDFQTGISTTQDVWRRFPISNTTSYEKYRLYITNTGGSSYVEVTELQLMGDGPGLCSVVSFSSSVNSTANPASYQWMVNGSNAGTDSSGFDYNGYQKYDTISCVVTSSSGCTVTTNTAMSNEIVLTSGPVNITNNYSACFGDSVLVGSNYYYSDTTINDVYTIPNQCDSTITSVILVSPSSYLTTSVNNITITSNAVGGTYQWINCAGNTTINGETNASFTLVANGDYAVIVTVGSCSDTSSCVNINTVGISEANSAIGLKIFPNPASGNIQISSTVKGDFSIVNEVGQTIRFFTLNAENNYTLRLEYLKPGVYFILGQNNDHTISHKIIVTR